VQYHNNIAVAPVLSVSHSAIKHHLQSAEFSWVTPLIQIKKACRNILTGF
jgi:hypothetical protein